MRSLFVTASALTLLCGAALAQTSTSGSNSNANVDTKSGSRSNSISNPQVNVYGNPIGNGASSSNSSASGRSNSNSRSGAAASSGRSSSNSQVIINNNTSSGSTGGSTAGSATAAASAASTAASSNFARSNYTSTQTLRNTPEIVAPSIIGGDPCTVGATGGVSLPGFGIVAARSWEGAACERRQVAALLYNMGHDHPGPRGEAIREAAVEVMCVERGVREALKRIGQPCVADRGTSKPPSAVVSETPIAVAIATPPPVEVAPPKQRPDWCSTTSAQERRVNKVCGE